MRVRLHRRSGVAWGALALWLAGAPYAWAQAITAAPPASADQAQPAAPASREAPADGEASVKATDEPPADPWETNLLGDLGGLRTRLADHGLTFGLTETSEVFGNASGGLRQGAIYEGLTQFGLGVDTGKAFGWEGGIFNVSAFQIHGRGLSLNNLDNNLNTVSSIEAYRGTLLFELWYEQVLLDKKLDIRVGQLAADQEFMISQYAGLFMNHTFGWSTQPSTDLPAGGPAYPLATPGVRVRSVLENVTLLGAVFNGNPVGPGAGPAQYRDPSGTAFRLGDGVLAIAELQYAINGGEGADGLAGTYRLGAWYDSDSFADQRLSASGMSLAAPGTAGVQPRSRRGNYSVYAVADQLVWLRQGTKDDGIGVFTRMMGAPGDRNLVSFYVDAGATWKGAIEGRDDDTVGLAVGYARISDTAAKLDSDTAFYTGSPYPIRRNETVLELTYQAQMAAWWQVQPDAQYVFNLNGGVPSPVNPSKRVGNAAVFGIRSVITF